jgi:hypothetical protein
MTKQNMCIYWTSGKENILTLISAQYLSKAMLQENGLGSLPVTSDLPIISPDILKSP